MITRWLRDFGRLPTLPGAARRLLEVTAEDPLSGPAIVQAVGVDPAGTARILSLAARSGLCGEEGPRSVEQAVAMLGPEVVALTALDFTLWQELPADKRLDSATHQSLWTHCLVVALCSRGLSKTSHLASPAQAYLCGLMSHFGQLILIDVATAEFAQAMAEADGRLPTAAQEREKLGADHRQLGATLLSRWGVSRSVTEVITLSGESLPPEHHEDPRVLELARIVHVADRVCQHWSPAMDGQTLSALLDTMGETLELSTAELTALREALTSEFAALVPLLTGAQLAGDDCAVLLRAAEDRKMAMAASTGRLYVQSLNHCRELEQECSELTASAQQVPATVQRFVAGALYAFAVLGFGVFILAAGSALMFVAVYLMKSAFGIDLLTGRHLGDLLPFT